MKQSQLVAIIQRLEAMQSGDGEPQTRRFEKNGEEKGVVSYDPTTQTYELEETGIHQTFQFDNIDLAAMEIYDLMDFDADSTDEQNA